METDTDIDPGTEAPAIRALGSLFKITQVFLWEDASFDALEPLSASAHFDGVQEEATNLHGPAVSTAMSSGIDSTISAFSVSLEDMELVRQMNELGLPISFSTNKEKKIVTTKKKRRSIPQKSLSAHEHIQDQLRDDSRVSEEDSCIHPIVCQDNTNTFCIRNGQHDTSYCCFAEDDCKQQFLSGKGDYVGSTTQVLSTTGQDQVCKEITGVAKLYDAIQDTALDFTPKINTRSTMKLSRMDAENFLQNAWQDSFPGHEHEESDQNPMKIENLEGYDTADENTDAKQICDGNSSEKVLISESAEPSQSSYHLGGSLQEEYDTCKSCSDLGDWSEVWDDFYMRNYFYNIRTHESTWYPPPGMGYFAFSDSAAKLGEMIVDASENHGGPELSCNDIKILDVHVSNNNNQFLQEVHNDDGLSSQSSLTVTSSMEHATANCMSCLTPATACSTIMHSDKLEANITCFEIKRNSDEDHYPVHSCSFPDAQEPVDSLPNICNQLGLGEVLRSEPQPALMKSKTDDLDAFDHFDEAEVSATSVEAVELSEDSPLHVLDGERSITSVTEICCKENEESDVSTCLPSREDEVDGHHDFENPKRKKKAKIRSQRKKLSADKQELPLQGMLEGLTVDTVKYWCQRYLLFSRFDDGIKMDEEGWFSVTPEPIATHQASRCGSGTIIDCFTGVGGNAIQFAKRGNHVIAIDIDPLKINYAQHNATIYGVHESIDFIKGDFFHLAPKLKGDIVFMSPPWGGPDYAKVPTYDIGIMLKPHDGYFLFKIASEIASRIVMFLPRNVDINQLAELSLLAKPPWSLEVEKNFLNGKLKAITAYFEEVSL